jgi:hypothetical protein
VAGAKQAYGGLTRDGSPPSLKSGWGPITEDGPTDVDAIDEALAEVDSYALLDQLFPAAPAAALAALALPLEKPKHYTCSASEEPSRRSYKLAANKYVVPVVQRPTH